jgi:predicted transcriptional regulator
MFTHTHGCVDFILEKSVQPEERVTELFFLLASMDRKRILSELQNENLKLNEIAKRLDMTSTESLRQLQRLTEAHLLEKMPAGTYRLTPYAKLVLDTSSPLDFICKFREFFLDHDTSLLPEEFRARLGELSGCKLTTSTAESINTEAEMLRGAQKRIDGTVVGFKVLLDISMQRLQEGAKVRWLMNESFLTEARSLLRSAKQLPEMRSTPRVLGNIGVTDRMAMVSIRRIDGTMSDYSFYGEDASFMKWADDLFMHEWEKAKPWHL